MLMAPLLCKHVVADVGRHVFAAQTCHRVGYWHMPFDCNAELPYTAIYYPALPRKGILFILAFLVGPFLYFRAKYKMLDKAVLLTTEEKDKHVKEIKRKHLLDA